MRAATLLALMGVSRPIYHLIILNEAILIVLSNHINIMLLPASHVTYTVYNFTDLINNSVCLSVCLFWQKCGNVGNKPKCGISRTIAGRLTPMLFHGFHYVVCNII